MAQAHNSKLVKHVFVRNSNILHVQGVAEGESYEVPFEIWEKDTCSSDFQEVFS